MKILEKIYNDVEKELSFLQEKEKHINKIKEILKPLVDLSECIDVSDFNIYLNDLKEITSIIIYDSTFSLHFEYFPEFFEIKKNDNFEILSESIDLKSKAIFNVIKKYYNNAEILCVKDIDKYKEKDSYLFEIVIVLDFQLIINVKTIHCD